MPRGIREFDLEPLNRAGMPAGFSDRDPVNLTRFSVFCPGRREFILEGQEFFASEISSVSSR